MRTLNDAGIETEAPIEIVDWTNEEGVRFSPAMIGSGVWGGAFDLDYGHNRPDREGRTISDELERIGYRGSVKARAKELKAAFEVHIEQGPILEQEELQIGVVTGVQGMNWYDLTIVGQPCHAGPTPMEQRQDPFMGLTAITHRLYEMVKTHGPWSRITFGDIRAEPGSRNTVPERLILAIDLRHPDQEILLKMDMELRQIVKRESEKFNLTSTIEEEWHSPAVVFNQNCISAVQNAVSMLGYANREVCSGAGHDSVYVSRVAPTSMIFVPCRNGLSHNEEEYASPEDLEAGCNVLLHAVLDRANDLT